MDHHKTEDNKNYTVVQLDPMDNKDLSLEKMMETEILLYSSIIQEWNLAPILKGSSDIGVLPTLSSRSEIVS